MSDVLQKYLPEHAVQPCFELIKNNHVHLKIVNERVTRHGDYRKDTNGYHQITVNASLNKYGRYIKPHGDEWKLTFRQLMLPYIRPEIFPNQLLPLLARHFKNPKASSDTDATLSLALKQYDANETDKNYIFEIPYGAYFRIHNGRVFKKIALRVKRYECIELQTGRIFLFQPNAEVELVTN